MPYTLHVVSHTHWDREWYLPHEVFRLRLVRLVDNLLRILDSDPSFRHFSLDAQTIVLEDYLEVRPHQRSRLEALVRDGRIAVGPWYQLNDEFLVSGEATVRSLLIGHRIAGSFGRVTKVGYLPDQFGNISQMPQILRGFGIDNAIMGRGRQLTEGRKMEFWWAAPDGSRVLASLMALWYSNAQYIPADPRQASSFLTDLRNRMARLSASHHLLLMNGVDHLEPQPWIGATLQAVAPSVREATGDTVSHSSLADYVAAIKEELEARAEALETVVGELREDRGGACLAGTLSTRVYLKQANDSAQTALERYAEPLSAFARIHGFPYPSDELRYAWQLLMQNHPHDSICGCSVDQVHDEMMPRFQRVEQVAASLVQEALDAITGRDRTRGAVPLPCDLYVFNTLNWTRTDPVRAVVEVSLGPPARGNAQKSLDARVRGLRILGPDGAEQPYEVIADKIVLNTVTNPLELPLDQWVQRIELAFVARDVPPCGYAVFRIEPAEQWCQPGSLSPCDGSMWPFSMSLEDVGDAGDEYLYRRPLEDVAVLSEVHPQSSWSQQASAVRSTREVRIDLQLPGTSTVERRSPDRTTCPVVVSVTRWTDVPRYELSVEVENNARDHRLRLCLEAGGREVVAGSPFDAVVRPARPAEEPEGAAPFMPFTLWIAVDRSGSDGTMTIIAPGLHEYEAYADSAGSIQSVGVTLLRCVGQLSGRGDGPGIETPGAQCQGRHVFQMAVTLNDGDWLAGKVWQQAHQFAAPLLAVQAPAREDLERRFTYVHVAPASLIATAIKASQDRDTLVVRCYNTTEQVVKHGQVGISSARAWRRVSLNEDPQEDWQDGNMAILEVRGKGIVTLEFQL